MSRKKRLSAEDWVKLGLTQLSKLGAEAVKLEAICAAAHLTRGSFYHHFKDHRAFLIALAQGWQKISTEDVANDIHPTQSKEEFAALLTKASLKIDYRLELGIRELARRTPEIDEIVKATDQKRLGILREVYAGRFKISRKDAETFAFLEYAAFSGMILLEPDVPKDRQQMLAARYDELMRRALGKPDTA